MRTHFYLLLAVCLPVSLFSQNTLRGKIIDAKGQPVEFAAVTLLLKSDSSLVKGEVTDGSGVYEMINIAPGSYFMETSMIGYATSRSDVFEIKNQPAAFELPALLLREAVAVLDEVVVKERKPFITQQIDRTVLNIENSITGAGANVLELLAKAPGVMVDDNGTISLRGKASVLIYIDGKPTYLAGNQLMELLRSTPATNIASIEIITNPPAKYDAAGNAGIINIKMKKNQADGFNGNVSGSFTQGFYDKENAGINLNFRQGKLNLFGNYNFSNWQGFNRLELHRNFHDNGELAAVFDQNNFSTWKGLNHSIRTGLDFSPSDKTTIGVLLTGTNSDNRGRGHNITFLQDGAYQLESIADTRFVSDGYWRNLTANANLKHTFDTLGRELTADLDYALYRQENQQRFTTLYTDDNGQTNRPDYSLRSVLPGNIDIYSAKVDYSNPLGKDAKWEAGAKASYVTNDNDARFFNVLENGSETPEASMTNYFVYSEQIMAAYANYSAKWGKTSVQFGLRGEHTNARGDQRTIDSTFHRQYFQLFPIAFLQREFGKDHQ